MKSFFVFKFLIFTLERSVTLVLSNNDSSIILEFEYTFSNSLILSSSIPCAFFAASYSAFSDRSPLSLASAIALAYNYEEVVLILDDLKARKEATKLGFKITGTLGILFKLKLL